MARPLALNLLKDLGSLAAVLSAAPDRQARAAAGSEQAVQHLATVRSAILHVLRHEALEGDVLSSTAAVAAYLRVEMAHEPSEQLRVLFLAPGSRLLADEVMFRGTVDSATIFPREIVHRALNLSASSIIMVHNHPSGDPTPSRADVQSTRDVVTSCKALDIQVHDHIIVAKAGWTSFRQQGLM
jgi:DNA repair protein RadC